MFFPFEGCLFFIHQKATADGKQTIFKEESESRGSVGSERQRSVCKGMTGCKAIWRAVARSDHRNLGTSVPMAIPVFIRLGRVDARCDECAEVQFRYNWPLRIKPVDELQTGN